jgi:hypothetical protein
MPLIRTMSAFSKASGLDPVYVNVIESPSEYPAIRKEAMVTLSDAALTAHALASTPPRAVWDETDLCALGNLTMPEPGEAPPT